jgi:hypothetical protein
LEIFSSSSSKINGFLQPLSLIVQATKLGLFLVPKMEKSLNSFCPAQAIVWQGRPVAWLSR